MRPPVPFRHVALLFLLCLTAPLATVNGEHVLGGGARHLSQTRETKEVVVSKENAKLAKHFEEVKAGETILIKASKVALSEVLTIGVDELHIKGASKNRPAVIQCTSDDARIDVISDKVTFENVEIRGCLGPAVRIRNEDVVDYDPFAPEETTSEEAKELSARFINVRFFKNTQKDSGYIQALDGGAMQINEKTQAFLTACHFENNSAVRGGAVHVDSGSLTVTNCTFIENEAEVSGGAISGTFRANGKESMTTFHVTDSVFLRNRDVSGGTDDAGLTLLNGAPLETSEFLSFPAPSLSGGAIHIQGFHIVSITGSLFEGNTAVPAGGAIFVSDNDQVELLNNTFQYNVAGFPDPSSGNLDLAQGGAIYVAFTKAKSKIQLRNCIFKNNTATYGGGLHMVMMLTTNALIEECKFIQNSGHLGGGGLLLRNTIEVEVFNSRFYRNRATAGGGVLLTNGAGLRFTQGEALNRNTIFKENIAFDGGACFFLGAGQVATQMVSFIQNKAQRNGGGLCLVESLASGMISLDQSLFLENKASKGGGLFVDSIASLHVTAPYEQTASRFIRNKAMSGGAIYLRPSSQVKNVVSLFRLNCTDNKAVMRMEDIYSSLLPYSDLAHSFSGSSQYGRRLKQTYFQDKADGTNALLHTTGEDPCSPGGGGAICLVLSEVPERAFVKVKISLAHLKRNYAGTGGAIFIATKRGSRWQESCSAESSTSQSLTDSPCRQLSIRDVVFKNNVAAKAGGAVFASDPEQVHYSSQKDVEEDMNFKPLNRLDKRINSENYVEDGGYGGQYASNAVKLQLVSPNSGTMKEGHQRMIKDHASGTPLPVITFKIVDGFDNTVSGGIYDSKMKVTASSDQGIVSGQLVATADAGIVVFDSLVVTSHPGVYTLYFNPEMDGMKNYLIFVNIRHCNIGEHNITEGKICSACQPGFYGFDPTIPCQACKNEANCSGGASQVPKNGYWHSTPFSTQFHECLVPRACSYRDRSTELGKFAEKGVVPSIQAYSNDDYPQCSEGYNGVLCGSCEENYGGKPGGECIECRGRMTTYGIVSIIALWQLILLGFTIRSALNSIRDMRDMRAIVMQAGGGEMATLPSPYQFKQAATPSAASLSCSSRKLSIGGTAAEFSQSFAKRNSERSLSLGRTPSSKNLTPIDHIVAAETVSETIKIAVNFLQVTSVAVSINVEWTETVKRMLETENSAAGFSNGATLVPLTCLLESSSNRSIHGMILRVVFPTALMFFVIFLFFLNWLRIRKSQNKGFEYIHSRSVICILVALFFSYESLNRELMRVVNCVHLDDEDLEDETGYSKFAVARGKYWGEDTSFKCFEGIHFRLLVILGIPGLIAFSFGIPAFLLAFLLYNREHSRLNEQNFLNTYGFIYQNYKDKFVFWEVCIMLRKACIGGIVVFAYPLGANLQGIMALGVLILALALHLVATPFKYRILNILESFSLLVSIFTFYSGIVFNDTNTTYPAKVLLSALLVLINSSLFVMFMVRVLMDVDKFITAKLAIMGEMDIPGGFIGRCMKLASVMLAKAKVQVQTTIQCQASRFTRIITRSDDKSTTSSSSKLSEIREGDAELAPPASCDP